MKLFCVIGNPIAHSNSPFLHNFVFDRLKIDAKYSRYLLKDAKNFKEIFLDLKLNGANITLPHKEIAFDACDEIDSEAKNIGAINTIINKNEKLIGHNTDTFGFLKSIENKDIKSALIIGAGGSARAISHALKNTKIQLINRSDRNFEHFKHVDCAISSEFESKVFKNDLSFDLIINATSSSINGELPLKKEVLEALFSRAKVALDLMYGRKIPFLSLARECNIEAINGETMLLFQAIKASSLFLDIEVEKIAPIMMEANNFLKGSND